MDQDSRTDESRERALSSEPSSTRPHPIDDDDSTLSARKRRRTSLSGSRSSSVGTLSHDDTAAAADVTIMKIDTPEPAPPSTPARPAPAEPAEPVSSRVTINLRNAESLEVTPTSPESPTPAPRPSPAHVRASVEIPEVDMTPAQPADDTSSSSSTLDSPTPAGISIQDLEDESGQLSSPIGSQATYRRTTELTFIVSDFPYRYEGELPQDTVSRLVAFFRQQPANPDEVLISIHTWLSRCLSCARPELRATVVEVHRDNKTFWNVLPELFIQVGQRQGYTRPKETRDLITQLLAQFAKLTAFLLNLDVHHLSRRTPSEEDFAGLMSPPYVRVFSLLPHPDEPYISNGVERIPNPLDPLEVFQSSRGSSLATLVSFIEYHTTALPQFPRILLDNLCIACLASHSIVRDSLQKQFYSAGVSQDILERSRSNLVLGYRCFGLFSSAMNIVMEKSINNLSQDNAGHISHYTSEILKHSLQGSHPEAIEQVQKYRQEHHQVPQQYACEAMALEWRFQIFCKLIRSPQMQLRVSAASLMCEELVTQWKRYQDRQHEPLEDTQPYLDYLRHLSGYIMGTGIVDYILGPTCHPEVTTTSGNIIGFLAVTKTYTMAQTNLMWQTLTLTQDPRIAEALVKMMAKVILLLQSSELVFLLEKFQHVPVDSFTTVMRDLFDNITEHAIKSQILPLTPTASYEVCVRLLRESSVFTSQGTVAYPEIYQFAQVKLRRLLGVGPSEEGRRNIALSCLSDVASKSETSSGSLQVLSMLAANHVALQTMIEEHNFIQLLVDDLEAAVQSAKSVGITRVYANPFCQARRKFISSVVTQFGSAIDTNVGQRLWDYLVGDKAISDEDRRIAWEDLYGSIKRRRFENQFLINCVRLFLPNLSPSCHCYGSLAFVREVVVPAANDSNGIILDDQESIKSSGLELFWQMILTAPSQEIANGAISSLVNEIYVDSLVILSYPLQRARKVHFSLVHRCLSQLKSAAQKLKAFNDGTTSNDDEPMVIVATDDQYLEQELRFSRTLQVLTTLSSTLRTKSNFAAPDLRSLMLSSPSTVNGDLADLKYQSFDGDEQTDIKPLKIGLKNSVASLLASLREATGFENYRLYYRGVALTPSDANICMSLEELNIRNGLILVKRELDLVSSPVRIKPGSSPLEIEILSHFNDLWEYLCMEEGLAREIYKFLISLPANDSILMAFEHSGTSPRDIFPLGQPFKSLYALHALREYLHTRRLKDTLMHASSSEAATEQRLANDHQDAIAKAIALIVAAICDPNIIDRCSNEDMRMQLALELVDTFVHLLKDTIGPHLLSQLLTPGLYERLMTTLTNGLHAKSSNVSVDLVHRCFEALLECCAKSDGFWQVFRAQQAVAEVIQSLLLVDERPFIRKSIAKLICTRSLYDSGQASVLAIHFAELFWPIILQLLPLAASKPGGCEEIFTLASHLSKKLIENESSILEVPSCVKICGDLLLSHTSTEDISHPEMVDKVALGLMSLLRQGVDRMCSTMGSSELPATLSKRLFSKHLFPPEKESGPLVPHAILCSSSRHILYDIIYMLAKNSPPQMISILQNLNHLTEHPPHDAGMDSYKYELPQTFERANAIRSVCGYSGLRNLSNTCYLNSLFTQLFMNIGFRQFIMNARIDKPDAQLLLSETQMLFANLQDSRRRFIDPQACVEQITNYEDLPVDIHSQMDVDEFFNLLFDRWEAQFTADSDKKALRSVYGGQLVQQVKSMECDHISERIEPFSAIQCDIKGKTNLEESLQAYVDGEIMEGDNKYKCSTCDRHVDAVKRACLKDLPDNLIFHLKRFDFNLRLLQRSKINDYFPFPNKIDMQPYTVEHLSDPSRNAEPDTFELVGILVHSGTAETGHYYSFIRERPTNCDTTPWVEFNDDMVTSWDPSQMESACFGGQDHHRYDNGTIYEKVYSAYMLFYQRSSSLRQEQEILEASGNPKQLRMDVSPDLELQVKQDNWAIMQRHNLYDPSHISFILKMLEFSWSGKCSKDHKKENLAMQVALGHLDQIVSRTKDLPDFDALSSLIITACQQCSLCCFAFFDYFQKRREALRMLLFRNSDINVRQDMGHTLLSVLKKIKINYPDEYGGTVDEIDQSPTSSSSRPTVLEATADLFVYIWESFHTRLAAWPEYFGAMVDFAKLGRLEAAALLDRDFLVRIIMTVTADQALELAPQYSRLLSLVSRRMASRPPNYEAMIALADILMDCMDAELSNYVEDYTGRLALAQQNDPIPFTAHEINILHRVWGRTDACVFTDKLIQLNQNPVATDSIISRLVTFNARMDTAILRSLLSGITGHIVPQSVTPFLRAGVAYCASSPNRENVHRLIRHVSDQCKVAQNSETRSFFEFQRDVFDMVRSTGETKQEIQLHSLRDLPHWIPGLLGYLDRAVSGAVEVFVREKLFKYGTDPVFDETSGGGARSRAMINAARELAVNIIFYLHETYVTRGAQASRDTMQPFHKMLQQCDSYFRAHPDLDDDVGRKYQEFCPGVMEAMRTLTVDEIEDEGSDWDQSVASSDSLADLSNMQVDQELMEGGA
ncbi:hypothetical protein F4777DRAFT_574284 [Nemania sp. FL0916]|nr:hypothetical protein F4777DRAFT_574284 [Nemania sp. FL0916]